MRKKKKTVKLKGCPFCGGKPRVSGWSDRTWYVNCMRDHHDASGELRASIKAAALAWNRRPRVRTYAVEVGE